MKSDSFSPYLDLPERAGRIFELAVGSPTAPRQLLHEKGWELCDPLEPSRDPWAYQRYIQQSKAEFSVAKQGYVITRSGWFSERSAAYLATGRPVLLEETGYSDWLPTGAGVIPFRTPEEALAGTEEINSRYDYHCRAARAIAEEHFDSRKVLPHLIERAMNPAPPVGKG